MWQRQSSGVPSYGTLTSSSDISGPQVPGLQSFLRLKDIPLCAQTTVFFFPHLYPGAIYPGATMKMAVWKLTSKLCRLVSCWALVSVLFPPRSGAAGSSGNSASPFQVLAATPASPQQVHGALFSPHPRQHALSLGSRFDYSHANGRGVASRGGLDLPFIWGRDVQHPVCGPRPLVYLLGNKCLFEFFTHFLSLLSYNLFIYIIDI